MADNDCYSYLVTTMSLHRLLNNPPSVFFCNATRMAQADDSGSVFLTKECADQVKSVLVLMK